MSSVVFTQEHVRELIHALHNDQEQLVKALKDVLGVVRSYEWATEGRGCHEWDDDRFFEVFGLCLDGVREVVDKALNSNNEAHRMCCGTYRHFHDLPKRSFQYGLRFGETYEQFADRMMAHLTRPGVID